MAKKQMWLGSVLAPCGGAQPLLLALMDNGGSPGKKGNAYTVLCCHALARVQAGTFGWRAGNGRERGQVRSSARKAIIVASQMQHNGASICGAFL